MSKQPYESNLALPRVMVRVKQGRQTQRSGQRRRGWHGGCESCTGRCIRPRRHHCGVVERLLSRHGYIGLLEGRNETIQCELSAVARAGDWLALRHCRLTDMAVFEKNAEDAVADTVTAAGQRNATPPGWCYNNGKGESQHPA